MELGQYGWGKRIDVFKNNNTFILAPIPATRDYGNYNIGLAPFDGVSTGHFVGSINGTNIAFNALQGFTGNYLHGQLFGSDRFKLDYTGLLTLASSLLAGPNAAPFPLTTIFNKLGSNVAMTLANTFYDGPTAVCTAGTWLLIAGTTITSSSATGFQITTKIWDGTTALSSGELEMAQIVAGMYTDSLILAAVATPSSTTTYKASTAATGTGATIAAAAPNNGAGNTATWIIAIKLG